MNTLQYYKYIYFMENVGIFTRRRLEQDQQPNDKA